MPCAAQRQDHRGRIVTNFAGWRRSNNSWRYGLRCVTLLGQKSFISIRSIFHLILHQSLKVKHCILLIKILQFYYRFKIKFLQCLNAIQLNPNYHPDQFYSQMADQSCLNNFSITYQLLPVYKHDKLFLLFHSR